MDWDVSSSNDISSKSTKTGASLIGATFKLTVAVSVSSPSFTKNKNVSLPLKFKLGSNVALLPLIDTEPFDAFWTSS